MMGHVSEEQLVLFASGDVPAAKRQSIADHVQICPQCQRVLAEFREIQNFIAGSLADPELCDLIQVRERVTAKVRRRDR